jgi:RNA polymerase sigma-70 factor (ECF subfamily)
MDAAGDPRIDTVLLAHALEGDGEAFGAFYRRHVRRITAFHLARTHEAQDAADLTAETFAAALAGRRGYRPDHGTADAWLSGIAAKKLAVAERRGYAERRARRRLGMQRIELDDEDLVRIERLTDADVATVLVDRPAGERRGPRR